MHKKTTIKDAERQMVEIAVPQAKLFLLLSGIS
jgi:hypothetical protein